MVNISACEIAIHRVANGWIVTWSRKEHGSSCHECAATATNVEQLLEIIKCASGELYKKISDKV